MDDEELKHRVNRLRQQMSNENIDLLLITPGANFAWSFGLMVESHERLMLGMIPVAEGDDISMVHPSFEKENVSSSGVIQSFIGWQEYEDPYEKTAAALSRKTGGIHKIGLEPQMWYTVYDRLTKSLNKSGLKPNFTDASEIFNTLRRVKSPEEIRRLEIASKTVSQAIEMGLENTRPGMTEREIQALVIDAGRELGAEKAHAMVQTGPNSAIPHGNVTDRKLQADEVVLIDAVMSVGGYIGDITMTTFIGKPSSKFLKIYSIVEEANVVGRGKAASGIPCEDVDRTTREVIVNAGFGDFFTHRTGHGLGIEVHEEPYIVEGNKLPLEEGMTHTVEPGIYILGEFGVRIEDDVVITSEGCRRLSHPTRRYWESG